MTALATALDIPDDEPRVWRGLPAAAIVSAVWLVGGVVFARTFALGGTTSPHLIVGGLLAVPAMVAAWVLAGPNAPRLVAAVVAMAAGVALMPFASHGATPSPHRLSEITDAIGLPGKTATEKLSGNGRCRPLCSTVERDMYADGMSFAKVRAQTIGILKARGFRVTGDRVATSPKMDILFQLTSVTLTRTKLHLSVVANGPTPTASVGDDIKKP